MLDTTEFSLAGNLDFVVSMMLSKSRQRNIDIRLNIEHIENDALSADSLRLNQVLINLLSNAVKFSPEGSEVLLRVREIDNDNGFSIYSFKVADQGIGISEYQASRLFRPFEQADGSITRNYGCTATKEIRALSRGDAAGIPIVAMTANVMQEDIQKARDAGMNAHLGKPIELEAVFKVLQEYLRRR
jgi:signal transduction histidine kinase